MPELDSCRGRNIQKWGGCFIGKKSRRQNTNNPWEDQKQESEQDPDRLIFVIRHENQQPLFAARSLQYGVNAPIA